jgi:hypothetical protein
MGAVRRHIHVADTTSRSEKEKKFIPNGPWHYGPGRSDARVA